MDWSGMDGEYSNRDPDAGDAKKAAAEALRQIAELRHQVVALQAALRALLRDAGRGRDVGPLTAEGVEALRKAGL
jgi:hypothetical protein